MIKRALAYFAPVFGLGFALGTIRVLWLAPRLGERAAELAETPLMLAGSFMAARWVVRRWPTTARRADLATGFLALAVMLAFEFGVVLGLRGLTLSEYFATRDPVSGTVYACSLLAFALMPWLASRMRSPAARPCTRRSRSGA